MIRNTLIIAMGLALYGAILERRDLDKIMEIQLDTIQRQGKMIDSMTGVDKNHFDNEDAEREAEFNKAKSAVESSLADHYLIDGQDVTKDEFYRELEMKDQYQHMTKEEFDQYLAREKDKNGFDSPVRQMTPEEVDQYLSMWQDCVSGKAPLPEFPEHPDEKKED